MTESQNDDRYYPYLLKPIGPRLNGRTYLPVEALPVEMDDLTVGWVWWNDDDMAANCEYVPFDMSEYRSFGRGRWSDSIERRVRRGMLPSQAVADIRVNGVDDAPAYRGEPGRIPESALPIRLPYRHFLSSFGGYGSRNVRRDDDVTFQRAHTYESRVPDDAPVSHVAWERAGVVMGWLWWNDDLDAAWHIPNVTEPGSRIEDGVTLQFNHPWAWRMADLHEKGLPASRAIHELMNGGQNDDGSVVPSRQPLVAPNLRQLQEVTGFVAYLEAQKRYMDDWRAESSARETAERMYYAAHPDEAEAPSTAT